MHCIFLESSVCGHCLFRWASCLHFGVCGNGLGFGALLSGVQIRIKGLELPNPYKPLGLQVYKHCLHCAGKAIHAICIALFWDPRVPVSTSLTPKTRVYGFRV